MQEEINILILESDDHNREDLARAFQESKGGFVVSSAESPENLIQKGYDAKKFDVCVVDLDFGESFAIEFIAIYTFENPESICVAMSNRATPIKTVVAAAHNGASGFINHKCILEDVVKLVENLLLKRRKDIILNAHLNDLIAQKREEWQNLFPGKVVALVANEPVLAEDTRTRALVAYHKERPLHADWPDEPLLMEVSYPEPVEEELEPAMLSTPGTQA